MDCPIRQGPEKLKRTVVETAASEEQDQILEFGGPMRDIVALTAPLATLAQHMAGWPTVLPPTCVEKCYTVIHTFYTRLYNCDIICS